MRTVRFAMVRKQFCLIPVMILAVVCRRQFTVKLGTLFEDSHVPITHRRIGQKWSSQEETAKLP
jgi:hypothetical protein